MLYSCYAIYSSVRKLVFFDRKDKLVELEKLMTYELTQAKKTIEEKIPFNDISE